MTLVSDLAEQSEHGLSFPVEHLTTDQKVVCSNHAGCGDPVIRNSVQVIFGALEA
jgi:hypothetical protein